MTILACVSGHGFGHWTRTEPVLARLAEAAPVHVRSGGRPLPLIRRAPWVASLGEWDLGPGVVQRGPLAVDVPATERALVAHVESWQARLPERVAEARALGVRAVVGDVPPLAFEVAAALGVPAVAIANFTWSWIYEPYAAANPRLAAAVARLQAAEGLATHRVVLPGGGGLERLGGASASVLEAVLRRAPTCDRAEARRRLAALAPPGDRPRAVVSFGGYGDELNLADAAARHPDYAFVAFAGAPAGAPANVTVLPHDHGLPHQDLVLGADVVLSKPGYGTISECLTGPTPLVWVEPTAAFREHPHLVPVIERWLPQAPITRAALRAGAWGPSLDAARASAPPEPAPPGGVDAVAAWILAASGIRPAPG